jgi:hypothetical protein
MKRKNAALGGTIIVTAMLLAGPVGCGGNAKRDRPGDGHVTHQHAAGNHAAQGHAAHGQSGHSGDLATTAPAPRDYADAIAQLRAHMASLDSILKSGDYDAVHKDSVAICKIGESVGALAAAPGSHVPPEQVKAVTSDGAELSAKSRSFHKAAHSDDLATVRADFARMGQLIDSLELRAAQH